MDPITIDLSGLEHLKNLGPDAYICGTFVAALVAGVFLWKQIGSASKCYGCAGSADIKEVSTQQDKEHVLKGDSHTFKAVYSAIITAISFIMLVGMTCNSHDNSLSKVKRIEGPTFVSLSILEEIVEDCDGSKSSCSHEQKIIDGIKARLAEHTVVMTSKPEQFAGN